MRKMKKARILIVEDEAIVSEDLEIAIADLGYEVVGSVVSTDDAIKKAIELKPDLILMDIILKGKKNGIDASCEIKEKMDIPVIFLTAFSDIELIEKAKDTEPYAYIIKPFQERELLASIEIALFKNQMEKKLKESEKRLDFAVTGANLGLWDWNVQTGEATYNRQWAEMLGYSIEEIEPKVNAWKKFIHPDDAHEVMKILKSHLQGKIPIYEAEFRMWTRSGEWKWILSTGKVFEWDEDGNPVRITGLHRDITKYKQAEKQIQQINEELEKRFLEKTAELKSTYEKFNAAMEQTYHAQKMESVGILAGGIAHDFNNLLTITLGNISLAKMITDPKDEIFKMLSEAENASLRAKDLTQQLLTFSRGGEPVKKTISIAKLIKESVIFARRGSNVTCEFEIPDDLWCVDADEGQITQVISNIVINADQAMPEGGTIRVRCENVIIPDKTTKAAIPGSRNSVKISITDQGTGIPEEHIGQIFDPFFTTKEKGSGLGLATAYSIINKHSGHIAVESKVGTGSTFHIFLPSAEINVPKENVVDMFEEPPASCGERILVMDDDKNIRELLSEILTHYGYITEFASDGAQAIELYRNAKDSKDPFDAVIMDLTIAGGIGGKETIKELIKLDPDVKAIVSSGYSNDPIMANCGEYGFCGIISKPFTIDDLIKTLQDVLLSD
jgi:two-component system cell cycle sensor histidine kinase/response regulator CckA